MRADRIIVAALAAALAFFQPVAFAQSLLGFPPGTFSLYPPVSGGGTVPTFKWQNTANNAFLGSATTTNVGSTNKLGANGSFVSGDILIAQVIINGAGGAITPPAGWTQIGTQQTDVNAFEYAYFWHLCNGTESGSFPFTWTTAEYSSWTLTSYSGAAATPIDGSVTNTYSGTTTPTTSSITTTNANSLLVLIAGSNNATFTVPADMTSRFNVTMESNTASSFASDRAAGSAGAKTETFTSASVGAGGYLLVGLHP